MATRDERQTMLNSLISFIDFNEKHNEIIKFDPSDYSSINDAIINIFQTLYNYRKFPISEICLHGVVKPKENMLRFYFGDLGDSPIIYDCVYNSDHEPYDWKIIAADFNFNHITNYPFCEIRNQHNLQIEHIPEDVNSVMKELSEKINYDFEDLMEIDNYLDLYVCYKEIPDMVINTYNDLKPMLIESLPSISIYRHRVFECGHPDTDTLEYNLYDDDIINMLLSKDIYDVLVLK